MENNIEKNNEINEPEITVQEEVATPVESAEKKMPIWLIILAGVLVVAIAVVLILVLGGKNSNQNSGVIPDGGNVTPDVNGEENTTVDYTVTIVDDLGNPMSDVIVKFTDSEGQTKIKRTDESGVAVLEDATPGSYNVSLDTAPSHATVFESEFTLTDTKNSVTVYARNNNDTIEISGDVEEGSYAQNVSVGDYSVHTKIGMTTFLHFKPLEDGVYHFTITGAISEATIGYYGMPDDVQLINIGDYDEETKTLSLTVSYTDFAYIIGVESDESEDVEISIERVGNAPYYIYGAVEDGTTAENVSAGTYSLTGEGGKTTYVVFNPGASGIYKVSFVSDDIAMTVGYYGIPMFVQAYHCGDGEYDGKTFELIIQDGATPYVIGLNFVIGGSADLTIERIGDAPFDPQFAPWTVIQASADIVKCEIPAGSTITDLDITDKNLSVVLGDDGYYYTSDGKLVYIRINSLGTARYLDASLAYIYGVSATDNSSGSGGINFGGYVYDENGDFVGKYSYNEMLKSYYDSCSPDGICPLTEELAEAFKVNGNASGWWKFGTANYLFTGVPVYIENAWLFLCCTVG